MDYLIGLLIAVINFGIQTTFMRDFTVLGVSPNTALVFVVCFALIKNKNFSYTMAIFIGLLQDLLYGRGIGINILIYVAIVYIVMKYKENLPVDLSIIAVIYVAISTFFYHISYAFAMFFQGVKFNLILFLSEVGVIECALNVIWTLLLYRIIAKIYRENSLKFSRNR
jgi:rod shape-determining protein MreD